jgi:hypothetical protein
MRDEFEMFLKRWMRLTPAYCGELIMTDSAQCGYGFACLQDAVHSRGALHAAVCIACMAGWCSHRLEETSSNPKIIRPAYKAVTPIRKYKVIGAR